MLTSNAVASELPAVGTPSAPVHTLITTRFGELRYDAGGRLQGRVRGGYDTNGEFWLLQPEISYRLWRGLRVALLGEVIDAKRGGYENNPTSYFDSVRHEDRLGTRLEYHF